jgi:hypothetical protein
MVLKKSSKSFSKNVVRKLTKYLQLANPLKQTAKFSRKLSKD